MACPCVDQHNEHARFTLSGLMREPVRQLFKAISYLPLWYIGSLYLFALAATLVLGHYPVCSTNDPKSLGLSPLYLLVMLFQWLGYYWVLLWPVVLGATILLKLPWKRPVLVFGIGLTLVGVQFLFDPLLTLCWYAD